MLSTLRLAVPLLVVFTLSACDSAEERAEKHYQSGLELLAAGDPQRALVEFRNVFALNESHRDARLAYAKTARGLGNVPESYANYLRISEQDPNDMEARLALTEMAVLVQNWDEAERHGKVLLASTSEVEGRDIPLLALEFREAVLEKDSPRIRELTREAEALAEAAPDNEILHRILIEGYLNDNDIDKAIAITDRAIDVSPDSPGFYRAKAMLLARKEDARALEEHLRATVRRFPDNQETKTMLVRMLAQNGDTQSAQEFLRAEIETAGDKLAAHVTLISFLQQIEGAEATLAEIEAAIPLYENNSVLKALQAGVVFDLGQRSKAVTIMQSVVDNAEPGEETDRYRVTLAKMLIATGNEVGARQLVEAVLAGDSNQVQALKMSASWLIENDKADEAISTLRRVLDQAPEDAEAMTLMARAHDRNGNPQLAQDLLALAVEASGNAPVESLRFARLLVEQERYSAAEQIVIGALRAAPGQLPLLELLGQIYLETEDWARGDQVVGTMKRLETERGTLAADQLQLQMISRREGRDRGVAFLEEMINSEEGSNAAKIALIRARLSQNRGDEALALAQELVTDLPDDPRAKQVLGNTQFAIGQFDEAEATLQSTAEDANDGPTYLQYIRVLGAQGKMEEARTAIDDGLAAAPENPDLLWAKASFLERINEIDDAIEIYEKLYAQNSNSQIVANNLASLLATYRQDDAGLERAFTVGRRLRGTEVPPFQDTYGWILFRRGKAEEALTYLEPAAEALGRDPIVVYHLGRTYEALNRNEEALETYQTVVSLAGENDPRAQIADAKTRIGALSERQ